MQCKAHSPSTQIYVAINRNWVCIPIVQMKQTVYLSTNSRERHGLEFQQI